MQSSLLVRLGGIAAALGGLMWVVKAVGIMLTGDQPPVVFEIAPPFFAIGLVGLYVRLGGRSKRLGRLGLTLACLAFAAWTGSLPYEVPGDSGSVMSEQFVFPQSLIILTGFLGILGGLVLLGIATLRTKSLPERWRVMPLAMGLLAFPLMGVGGAIEPLGERYIEIPILFLGLAWLVLGYVIWPGIGEKGRQHIPAA